MKFLQIPTAFFIFVMLAAGCSGPVESREETENNHDNLVVISHEQFREEQMQLGNSVMHTFGKVFQTNGIVTASPQSKADVYSFVAGVIKSIAVNPGSFVRKGQVLCTLQSKEFINMQQDYLKSLAREKAVEADYKRVKTLYDEQIASQKDYLAIESEYLMLQAGIKSLKAEFRILNVDLSKLEKGDLSPYLEVLSPIEGYITTLNCNLGQFIDSQTLLMKVVDNRDLQLYFFIYQEDVNKISEGQPLKIYSPDDVKNIYKAEVISIGKAVDPESKSIQCIAKPEERLRKFFVDGMYFQVEVELDTVSSPALPSSAILKTGNNHFVLIRENENDSVMYFRKEKVNTGIVSGDFVQILDNKPLKNVLIKGTYYFQSQ